MNRPLQVDWPLCAWQAALLAVIYTAFSTMEVLRFAEDAGAAPRLAALLAISMTTWFSLGVTMAAGAQWTLATQRHRWWSSAGFVLLPALTNGLLTRLLRQAMTWLDVSAGPQDISWLFAFWRGLVAGVLFFGYCMLVHSSRQRRGQIERVALARASAEVRLREARLQALEHCVDPVLLERTIAALRTTYARDRQQGDTLLDALVEFLRAAMPALRAGTGLESDRAALGAWARLRAQLEHLPLPATPATAKGET